MPRLLSCPGCADKLSRDSPREAGAEGSKPEDIEDVGPMPGRRAVCVSVVVVSGSRHEFQPGFGLLPSPSPE